jgi:hypothetical protein
MAHQKRHLASDPPHAGGSLAAFTPRDASLRALAPQANFVAQLLTYTSTLRGLLATDPPSHDASKPICRFWPWLVGPQSLAAGALGQERQSLRPMSVSLRAPRYLDQAGTAISLLAVAVIIAGFGAIRAPFPGGDAETELQWLQD